MVVVVLEELTEYYQLKYVYHLLDCDLLMGNYFVTAT